MPGEHITLVICEKEITEKPLTKIINSFWSQTVLIYIMPPTHIEYLLTWLSFPLCFLTFLNNDYLADDSVSSGGQPSDNSLLRRGCQCGWSCRFDGSPPNGSKCRRRYRPNYDTDANCIYSRGNIALSVHHRRDHSHSRDDRTASEFKYVTLFCFCPSDINTYMEVIVVWYNVVSYVCTIM